VTVTTLRASTLTVSVLYAAAWLPWLLLGLAAGAWVDRLPRRRLMLACDAVSVLALASFPVAAWCGVLSVPQLLVVGRPASPPAT
jgi:MFS family permease